MATLVTAAISFLCQVFAFHEQALNFIQSNLIGGRMFGKIVFGPGEECVAGSRLMVAPCNHGQDDQIQRQVFRAGRSQILQQQLLGFGVESVPVAGKSQRIAARPSSPRS